MHNNLENISTIWSCKYLPLYLSNNDANTFKSYSEDGSIMEKKFSQIHKDVIQTVQRINHCSQGSKHKYLLIMGKQSYEWIIAALAGFYIGLEVIAFPETLSEEEAINCLRGIPYSLCFLDEEFANYSSFEGCIKFMLTKDMWEAEDQPDSQMEILEIPQPKLIAFTSGTTSSLKLKAFEVDTESTEHFYNSFTKLYGLFHDDNWVVCHSFTHIVHFEYVLAGLSWGINLSLVKPLYLIWNLKKIGPSVLVTVPVVYQQLVTYIKAKLPKKGKRADELKKYLSQNITLENGKSFLYNLLPEVEEITGNTLKMMLIGTAPSSEDIKRFLLICGLPIFEGYGLSETNMLTCNTPKEYYLGSVGVAWPGVELKIENNELKARLQFKRSSGYLNAGTEEVRSVFEDSGWINTGDISVIDKNFIFIKGRTKDTIITDRGKNINPNPIEEKLRYVLDVSNVVLYGDNRSYLIAIISLKPDQIITKDEIAVIINSFNLNLGEHEKIKNFILTNQSYTIENGLMTRSGKIRRKLIWEKYKKEIDECYE